MSSHRSANSRPHGASPSPRPAPAVSLNPVDSDHSNLLELEYVVQFPEIKQDPKVVRIDPDLRRMGEYRTSSVEKFRKMGLYPDLSLGIDLDFYDPRWRQRRSDFHKKLHIDDEALLSDEPLDSFKRPRATRSSYLMDNIYVDMDPNLINLRTNQKETEKKKEGRIDPNALIDQETQKMERTFVDAADLDRVAPRSIRHPSKRNVHAVSVVPFVPDVDHWELFFGEFVFDFDPEAEIKRRRLTPHKYPGLQQRVPESPGNPMYQNILVFQDVNDERSILCCEPVISESNSDSEKSYQTISICKHSVEKTQQRTFFIDEQSNKVVYKELGQFHKYENRTPLPESSIRVTVSDCPRNDQEISVRESRLQDVLPPQF